jgi:archaeal flagellin FlaB
MLKRFLRHEKGITGLETAIILIAFVVVAAVFAYTALSAGLFSTQKSQEAVYSGLREAQSTVELKGGIIATGGTIGATGSVKQISFVVSNALGGESIDFTQPTAPVTATGIAAGTANKVVINYIDDDQTVNNLFWTVNKLGNDSGDYLLSSGEKYEITVGGTDNTTAPGNLVNALNPDLTVNKTFSLVLVTPAGAVLNIERTTPAYIDTVMNLR